MAESRRRSSGASATGHRTASLWSGVLVPVLLLSSFAALAAGNEHSCEGTAGGERVDRYTLTVELTAPSCTRSKTIHLIRHAQGTHNAAESDEEERPTHTTTPEFTRLFEEHGVAWVLLPEVSGTTYRDPILTTKGELQATALRQELEEADVRFDLVVVSPMRRTLQTAHLGLPQLSSAQPPLVVAIDLVRERIGPYACDEREAASTLAADYPRVDFSSVTEEDRLFMGETESGPDEAKKLASRALRTLDWLISRPVEQEHIAVVSHQHFLSALVGLYPSLQASDGEGADEKEALEREGEPRLFRNAERRTLYLCEMY